MVTAASQVMSDRGFAVWAKFTSPAMYRSRQNHPRWRFKGQKSITLKRHNGTFGSARTTDVDWEKSAQSRNARKLWGVKYYWFEYLPEKRKTPSGSSGQ